MASIPEARTSFNLKVLRRHDASIVEIVETASFVVLYNYNGGEWTKTGVEGPLFLFRRRLPPYNGFFLMNRNGVENFSADVTQEDDLEITPEFIIYRPETNGDNEVYGIWVFEPGQRMAVGDKLLKLQQMTEPPSQAQIEAAVAASSSTVALETSTKEKTDKKEKKDAQQAAQTDKKKAKKKNAKDKDKNSERKEVEVEAEPEPEPEQTTQISLDDLFGGAPAAAAPQEAKQVEEGQAQQKTSAERSSLLDSMFASAVSLGTAPAAAALSTAKDAPELTPASTAAGPATAPQSNGASTQDKTSMSALIEQTILQRIALGDDGKPLSRREFVTELLSIIHTDPAFVTALYDTYLARVA
ncbi:predicted transporter [Moesziomyces antarcticus T-34]|uniref:Predicted transporter n=1 Tax=Pseudozyma antarctica (strain T-34) TaxID=1151754 RepID=M9LYX1_PSEA3|nr:predicted transporter [Moesziomyces antarcticus T-34]